MAAYVSLLPIQFLGERSAGQGVGQTSLNIAPADFIILTYLLVRLPRMRRVQAAWSSWHFALLAVLGIGALVSLSKNGAVSEFALLRKGVGLVVLLVTYACLVDFFRNWNRIRWLLRIFLCAVILNAGVAVVAMVVVDLGGPVAPLINAPWPGLRLSGLYLDANAFGGMIALALVLHQMTHGSRRPLLTGSWALAAHLVLPLALVLTFSRSSWLGLTLGLFVAAMLRPRACGRALVRIGLLLVPVASTALVVVPDVTDLITRPSQIENRVTIGTDAIREFLRSPLIGMGLGEYSAKYDIIVHNTVLWYLAEFGVIGLVVVAGFLASFVAKLLVAARQAPVEQTPLIVALLTGHAVMFGVSIGIEALYQRHWWLVMAAAGAAFALAGAPADAASRYDRPPYVESGGNAGMEGGTGPYRSLVPAQARRYPARADEPVASASMRRGSEQEIQPGPHAGDVEYSGSSVRTSGRQA